MYFCEKQLLLKMRDLHLFLMYLVLLAVTSCAKNDFETFMKSTSERYIRPSLEQFLVSQPESRRDSILEFDAAGEDM